MKEIKLNLEVQEEDITPVAGLLVDFDNGRSSREVRLIVKSDCTSDYEFMSVDLKAMKVTDTDKNNKLICLSKNYDPKIIGKLTL